MTCGKRQIKITFNHSTFLFFTPPGLDWMPLPGGDYICLIPGLLKSSTVPDPQWTGSTFGACMAVWMQAGVGNLDPGIVGAAGWGLFPFGFFLNTFFILSYFGVSAIIPNPAHQINFFF